MGKKPKGIPKKFATARRHLDQRLNALEPTIRLKAPSFGWIRMIREVLGMTATQLAQRVGVSATTILQAEKREQAGTITLATLNRIADGLRCEMHYVLVPQDPKGLEGVLDAQISRVVQSILGRVSASMALEEQSVTANESAHHADELAHELKSRMDRSIWDEA